jgi:hypothetical protein
MTRPRTTTKTDTDFEFLRPKDQKAANGDMTKKASQKIDQLGGGELNVTRKQGIIRSYEVTPVDLKSAATLTTNIFKACKGAVEEVLEERGRTMDKMGMMEAEDRIKNKASDIMNSNKEHKVAYGAEGIEVSPLQVVSRFFTRKFEASEEEKFGLNKLSGLDILTVFDAMVMFPDSLRRLAKDNTQFPARLVELNKDKLSIEEITNIGNKLLEIKESQRSVEGMDAKNPEQSESMKQIAEILKEKIRQKEEQDKGSTEHTSAIYAPHLSVDTVKKMVNKANHDAEIQNKAACFIRIISPEYLTSGEMERNAKEAEAAAAAAAATPVADKATTPPTVCHDPSAQRLVQALEFAKGNSFVSRVAGGSSAGGGRSH